MRIQAPVIPSALAAGEVLKRVKFRVSTKETWDAAWQEAPYLEPLVFSECAGPSMPGATFRYRFGRIKREDRASAQGYEPGRFRDRFVKIDQLQLDPGADGVSYTHGAPPGEPILRWIGRVTDEALQTVGNARAAASGTSGAAGDQMVCACGLAQELDKNVIASSVAVNGLTVDGEGAPLVGDDARTGFRIDEILVFNDDLAKGYVESGGNRSAAIVRDADDPGVGSYVFGGERRLDESTGRLVPYRWSALDIADYLLAWHGPPGITFAIGGAVDALAAIEPPEFRVAGMTVFQALNHLIDRKRGLGWCVRVNAAGTAAEVHVFTTTDVDVVFDDATLTANPDAIDLPVRDLGHLVRESQIRLDTLAKYDRIIVSGAPILVCFTVSVPDNTLTKAWDAAMENEYKAGRKSTDPAPSPPSTAETLDRARRDDRWRQVYTTYRIPYFWGWFTGNGLGSVTKTRLRVGPTDDGRISLTSPLFVPTRDWGHRLARLLPLRDPDITGANDPTPFAPPRGAVAEYRAPFLILRTPEGKYEYAEKVTAENGSCQGLRMLDRDFGFEVLASPNHLLARGAWTNGTTPGESRFHPEDGGFNYETMVATVAARTDTRLRVVVNTRPPPPDGEEPPEPDRVLHIDVPNAEFWWIAPNTVTGVKSTGELEFETRTGDDLVLRDDSARLRRIGALAKAWYGKERAAMRLVLNDALAVLPVGTFVRTVQDAENFRHVNSVVSAVTTDCEAQATVIETQYAELDVTAGEGPAKFNLR
jgi:hypothetical protein